MDEGVKQIYGDQVRNRLSDERYETLLGGILNICEASNVHIRADAVLFLCNNFIDIIVEPIKIANESGLVTDTISPSFDQQYETIYLPDIKRIIGKCLELMGRENKIEISSSIALMATSQVLSELNIDRLKVWSSRA